MWHLSGCYSQGGNWFAAPTAEIAQFSWVHCRLHTFTHILQIGHTKWGISKMIRKISVLIFAVIFGKFCSFFLLFWLETGCVVSILLSVLPAQEVFLVRAVQLVPFWVLTPTTQSRTRQNSNVEVWLLPCFHFPFFHFWCQQNWTAKETKHKKLVYLVHWAPSWTRCMVCTWPHCFWACKNFSPESEKCSRWHKTSRNAKNVKVNFYF